MRLSNLEEGSYNNAPEPKKMQVTVADKKANTEAWKRYQAGDSRYEFKNPTTEAEQEKAFLRRMQPGQPDIRSEGKSPHKKGTAKYKKHMAAMHAEGTQEVEEAFFLAPWILPALATAARVGAPALLKLLSKGASKSAPMAGNVAKTIVKNPGTTLKWAGAGYVFKSVYDVVEMVRDYVGDIMDNEAVETFAQIVWKYKLPAAAVIAVLYGGKKLKDYMASQEQDGEAIPETKINEFGPDERYMKIGNNTMIANKKTGSVSSTLNLGGDKSATVNNHLNKDGSVGKVSARGTVNGVKFKASNNVTGTAPKASASMRGITINASEEPKVREAGSPWTTTGKHPEKMTTDELWSEIAVFDHIQDRGERLTPKDMMRLDSLFSYMDTAEMNEQIKRKADSMMESAVWKENRNK